MQQWVDALGSCYDAPVVRSTIVDPGVCSRSPAYCATTETRDERQLDRTDSGYRLTGTGTAIIAHVRQFATGVAGTDQVQHQFE